MTFRGAITAITEALSGSSWLIERNIPCIEGIHSNLSPEKFSENLNALFAAHPATLVVELPGGATFVATEKGSAMQAQIAVVLAENENLCRGEGIDPLEVIAEVFNAISAHQQTNVKSPPMRIKPDEKALTYMRDKDGMIFWRLNFEAPVTLLR